MELPQDSNSPEAHSFLTHTYSITKKKTESVSTRTLRSCCILPQRYVLGVMGLLGICNAYTMRVCLNLAITQMVNKTHSDIKTFDSDVCPNDDILTENGTITVHRPYAIFDWNESTQGLILSGFYYGYAVAMIPGSYLTERFGGKWALGGGLLSTALFTFLTPIITKQGGAMALFVLRILQGMGESTLEQWRIAFWICFAILVGTNVVYCACADGRQQWWDDVRQYGYPDGWKHGPLYETRDDKVKHDDDIKINEKIINKLA